MSQTESGPVNFDDLLLELRDLVESARTMPMSASVLVNREEILGLVDEIFAGVPEEVRHARWLLKERDEFLASARREADDIIESARLRLECEDYIDHKLAEFEVVLERTMQAVQNGRAQLQVSIDPLEAEEPDDPESGFFDQDET